MKPATPVSEYQPPMRDGVTASKVYLPKRADLPKNLFSYLCEHFPHIPANEWQQRFQDQLIIDMQGQALTVDQPYLENTHLYYYRFLPMKFMCHFKKRYCLKMKI